MCLIDIRRQNNSDFSFPWVNVFIISNKSKYLSALLEWRRRIFVVLVVNCCQIPTLRDRFFTGIIRYAVPYSFGDRDRNIHSDRLCVQTKTSALSLSGHFNVVSAQSFHEGERQGDKFFNIVNYRI